MFLSSNKQRIPIPDDDFHREPTLPQLIPPHSSHHRSPSSNPNMEWKRVRQHNLPPRMRKGDTGSTLDLLDGQPSHSVSGGRRSTISAGSASGTPKMKKSQPSQVLLAEPPVPP